MKTNEFLRLLKDHSSKSLLFEYRPEHFVGANYHITEVKNITIDAVDCGAGSDFWKETVIQLWESPDELETLRYMSASKALRILDRVDRIKPMDKDVEVRFEYGNATFHTAQLYVSSFTFDENSLILKLAVEKTDCKAREKCGVKPQAPATTEQACCTPGSGCC